MSALGVWGISIVGIVVLTVLVDIILPDGETNKYLKSIMAVVTVFVIVQPLPALLNSDLDLASAFAVDNVEAAQRDEKLEALLLDMRVSQNEREAEMYFAANGYLGTKITLTAENIDGKIKIRHAVLNLKNVVIDKTSVNIISNDKMRSMLAEFLKISVKDVEVV